MRGLIILLSFQLLGLLLQGLGVPLPSNVLGLVLFTVALFLGWVKLEWVAGTARFLLRHMLLFFVPVIVGAMASGAELRQEWVAIAGSLVVSLLAGMLITGWTATALCANKEGRTPMTADEMFAKPVFGVAATCLAYGIWTLAERRWRWAHVMLGTCGSLMVFLLVARIPVASYKVGGDLISFFLGPATVALGVPFYVQAQRIRRHLPAIVIAVTAGSLTGMATAGTVAWALHASAPVLRAMVPKSVTTPISMEVARQLGGKPELAAVFTAVAGLIGSVIGPGLLARVGVKGEIAVGTAIGTSSHGLGTARLLRESELAGGVSGFAMALAGVITSLLAIPLQRWMH